MKLTAGSTRKGRSGNNGHGRRNAGCGPRMRWVMVSVSLAIFSVCAIAFLTMDVPRVRLNDYVLATKQMQALGLKSSGKLQWTRDCDGHGVRQDVYFRKYDGRSCGQSNWELNKETSEIGALPSKANMVYKIFKSNASAHEYYEKFWGRHLYERLPPYLYTEVDDAISDRVGDERKAYYWHPKQVVSGMPVPLQAARVPVHVICIFRQGPAFIRVIADGYFAGTNEKKLIQLSMSLSYDAARQVKRAMHKFTPMQQQFYTVQSQAQKHIIGGLLRAKSFARSTWTLYLKRIRNRLLRIAAFVTNHASSFSDVSSILSQVFTDIIGSRLQFWLVAVVILLLQPIQCSMTGIQFSLSGQGATAAHAFCAFSETCRSPSSVDDVRKHLAEHPVPIDSADEDGMTLLMHAAYSGKVDTCKLLLARKADANFSEHKHAYTTLMFGAMSGSADVVRVLLEAGANPDKLNNIGRNAGQLAAFIGHSHVGLVINCFFQRSTLDYYCISHGVETQPKLPPYVVPALYDLLSTTNIHPICILLALQANPELLHEVKKVQTVIELLVEKQYKELTNEVLSIKFHLIGRVLTFATTASSDSSSVSIDSKIKMLLRGREEDGFPATMELFLRSAIREYPYHQSVLLEQLVRAISPVAVGASPTSLKVLHSVLFGLQMYDDAQRCAACGTGQDVRKCSGCSKSPLSVFYCGRSCQALHWFTHKKYCQAAKTKATAAAATRPDKS